MELIEAPKADTHPILVEKKTLGLLPAHYVAVKDETVREQLKSMFPNGFRVTLINGVVVEVEDIQA